MMTFFAIIGIFVKGSGFEEIIFQNELCSSGSIQGVISGKHYNRCRQTHGAFGEALERLFIKSYIQNIPSATAVVFADI